jgi:putative Mg2+ transporter-C (MgtC) family protein
MTPSSGEIAFRLVAAFVLGALAGVERQWHHKHAGLRTHTLVAVGARTYRTAVVERWIAWTRLQ